MSAPEHPVLLWFDAHAAPVPGPRGERELDVLLSRSRIQLGAVLDAIANEATLAWSLVQATPPSHAETADHRSAVRAHFVAIALAATHRKAGPR